METIHYVAQRERAGKLACWSLNPDSSVIGPMIKRVAFRTVV